MLVFLPLMLIYYRVPPAAPMLLFPIFVALQSLFTIGVALILATSTAFFRDVRHLVEVALAVAFWTTPIVYQVSRLRGGLRPLILLSPMSPYIGAYQDIFYYRQWPDAAIWLTAIGYAAVDARARPVAHRRNEDSFAERI